MKKLISILTVLAMAVSVSSAAFAASTSETVSVSLDKIEDLIPTTTSSDTFSAQLLKAQLQYLTCCSDALTTNSNANSTQSTTQSEEDARKKYELGYISKQEYDDAVKATTDLTASQESAVSQREKDMLTLRHMFGLDDDDKMVLKSADYTDINLTKISGISLNNSLKEWNLYDLSGSDATDTETTGKVETFKSLYNAMELAYSTYQNDLSKYESKQKDSALIKEKYDKGYATKKELDDITLETGTLKNTADKDRNSAYAAYLRFDFLRENGYDGTTGG